MTFAVPCIQCGADASQRLDPAKHGALALCEEHRPPVSSTPIVWDPTVEAGAVGHGSDGRRYVVDQAAGLWRWRLVAGPTGGEITQAGALPNERACREHAEDHEVEIMSKKNKKKSAETTAPGANGAADAVNGAGTELRKYVERFEHTQDLEVDLDAAERVEMRGVLVEATCERVGLEEEVAVLREKIKGLKERETELADKLKVGKQKRHVKCVERLYVEENRVEVVRLDTGEVIETRTATAEDRQEDLELQESEARGGDTEPPAGAASTPHDIEDPDEFLSEDLHSPNAEG